MDITPIMAHVSTVLLDMSLKTVFVLKPLYARADNT